MIDPMASLAFSIYSNKGAYALLLGSGVSRASQIPTGWEVVLDLVRKVARMEGEECEADPAAWFRKKHSAEPDYSKLLDAVAKTQTERQQLLRAYFEPSEDERKEGLKSPSAAHKSIARLVAAGYVRIIVTTNFDRLMEKALEEVGVTPTIISTADQIAGALPLAHSGVTVIKLHGDYLDTRIRNTEAELAGYDAAFDQLLDRILDEYGLIICGWSAEWDIALRAAIERCPSRRFTTFWSTRSPLSGEAKRLAEHRRAEILQIRDADHLFQTLWEKVRALEDIAAPHPLSAKMAVATLKRYLVDPAARIRLNDLIHDETEFICAQLGPQNFPLDRPQPSFEELTGRAKRYASLIETLLAITVTLAYWGENTHAHLCVKMIERTANQSRMDGQFFQQFLKMQLYPPLLLIYAGGLASIAVENYATLGGLLTKPRLLNENRHTPLIASLPSLSVTFVSHDRPEMREPIRLNHHLFKFFRPSFAQMIPDEEDYRVIFDRFEYFLGLVMLDASQGETFWLGEYLFRHNHGTESSIEKIVTSERFAKGKDCPYLRAGLFGGTVERLKELQVKLAERQRPIVEGL